MRDWIRRNFGWLVKFVCGERGEGQAGLIGRCLKGTSMKSLVGKCLGRGALQ